MIEYLEWDSNFFYKKIGRIEFLPKKDNIYDFNLDNILINSDYQLIYLFLDISLNINDFIHSFNPHLVDTQIHLKIQISDLLEKVNYNLLNFDNLNNKYLKNIYKISEEASEISRFKYDSYLNMNIKKLYRKMVDNSLNSSYGSGIILDTDNLQDIKGFISLDLSGDIAKELLISVKKEFRSYGIGKILIKKALNCCKDYKKFELNTIVSAKNIDSTNFHISQGFKINKIINVYHLWLRDHNER